MWYYIIIIIIISILCKSFLCVVLWMYVGHMNLD